MSDLSAFLSVRPLALLAVLAIQEACQGESVTFDGADSSDAADATGEPDDADPRPDEGLEGVDTPGQDGESEEYEEDAECSGPTLSAPVLDTLGDPVDRSASYTVGWTPPPDAVGYTYELEESPFRSFENLVVSSIVAGTTKEFSHPEVVYPATFFYRVRSRLGCEFSDWSAIRRKQVTAPYTADPRQTECRQYDPPFSLGGDNFALDDNTDNGSSGTFEHTGPGWISRVEAGFGSFGFLGDYHYITSERNPDGSEEAFWTPSFSAAGRYEVWIGFSPTPNRDDHIETFVRCAEGNFGPFIVDAYTGSDLSTTDPDLYCYRETWTKLGEFDFEAGGNGQIRLTYSDAGRSYSEEADAVAFKYLGPPGP